MSSFIVVMGSGRNFSRKVKQIMAGTTETDNATLGKNAENLAADFLAREGYHILARNYRSKRSEIDIIAQKAETVVFVEVKYRSVKRYGNPEGAVSEGQIGRIQQAATDWQVENDYSGAIRFDIIAVSVHNQEATIRHFQDVS